MKDEIVESVSLFGYFSLEKIALSYLHSTSKSSFVDDGRYARLTIHLTLCFFVSQATGWFTGFEQ